jgi:phosphonatase-like hydrolase
MNEIKLVVFDLAGTTVQDQGQVSKAFKAALAGQNIEVNEEQLNRVRGSSKRQAILSFIPEGPDRASAAEIAYASFKEHLAEQYRVEGIEPVEGAERVFRWCRGHGVRIALNTGFDRDITALLLTTLKWGEGVVDAVVCGDEVRRGRPAPYLIFRAMEATGTTSVHEVMSVGDTILDLQAGHCAGVRWNVGVLSGAQERWLLEQYPHTHLLGSVAETPWLLDEV